eukprot:gnl/MRDRNA2_/MRDRNA2_226247_c0_seq1.p1 gnl/MRDRNA2_/MRDRNA2_226247_c0~~gnl/MRDRNA2_/MRDRNA2_226247_c0_seq1.p1  ORF type:complete len:541 (+),score=81.83 gnl/MRDRNA2_/MRDRNA2_226247_c0_seq1:100-1623(+)
MSRTMGAYRWHCLHCSFDMCDTCRANRVHKKPMSVKLPEEGSANIRWQSSVDEVTSAVVNCTATNVPADTSIEGKRNAARTKQKTAAIFQILGDIEGQEDIKVYNEWCQNKFGNYMWIRSWRALDVDGNMFVSRKEFFSLAKLGFRGELEKLWRILDRDDSNSLTFQHYAPEAAIRLASFIQWGISKYGNVEGMYVAFDRNHDRKLRKKEFQAACKTHGFNTEETIDVIFEMYGDVDENLREPLCYVPQRLKIANLQALARWDVPDYFFVDADEDAFLRLKEEIVRPYNGNALAAWRKSFDLDGSMRVSYLEFQKACKSLGRRTGETYNIAGAWRALDCDLSNWVSLGEFDSYGKQLLLDFKLGATKHSGSCQKFIQQIESPQVTRTVFQLAVYQSGIFSHRDYDIPASSKEVVPEELKSMETPNLPGAVGIQETRITREHTRQYLQRVDDPDDDVNVLFQALDVDDSGAVTSHNVLCIDKWDVDEEEAEERAWNKISTKLRRLASQ